MDSGKVQCFSNAIEVIALLKHMQCISIDTKIYATLYGRLESLDNYAMYIFPYNISLKVF